MSEQAAAKLRLSSPADLIEAVPYLLGYHPSNSMVALALRGPRREVVFTMRLDLPTDEADLIRPCSRSVAAYLAQAEAGQAVLVAYGDGGRAGAALPQAALVDMTCKALRRRGIEIIDAVYVGAGRWWSYTCMVPACCPTEGRPVVSDGSSAVAATATYAGLVALPNREAVEKMLEPVGFLAGQGMAQALARADETLAARIADEPGLVEVRSVTTALLTEAVDSEQVLPDDAAARLIVGIEDIVVRDECCEWAGTQRAPAALRLWVQLARRSTPGYDVVPLVMVAWFAWHGGDATLARIAVERCLRSDPDYSLAKLLQEALDSAVNPAAMGRQRSRGKVRSSRQRRSGLP